MWLPRPTAFCSTLSFIVKSSVAFIIVGLVCPPVSQSHMMLQAGTKVYYHRVRDRQTGSVAVIIWCYHVK